MRLAQNPSSAHTEKQALGWTNILHLSMRVRSFSPYRGRVSASTAVSGYSIDAMDRMCFHSSRYGLVGNPNVLTWLLARAPTTFAEYVHRK